VVPWVNRPLPLYVIPQPPLVRYPTTAPLCRAAQLRVSHGRTAVGLGNRLEELVFTNVGTNPCLLRGYPRIRAYGRPLHVERGGTYFGQLVAADLRPGGHVFLDIATGRACDGGRRPGVRHTGLVFVLPQGGSVHAGHVSITNYCGLSMSEFGLPRRYSEPHAAPGTPGMLQAHLLVPPSARAGAVLRYTAVLSNTTRKAVRFQSCPGYTEGVYVSGHAVRKSYALNCDSVQSIPPHGGRRFAMRLALPRRAVARAAKISWNLDTPTGPFAAGLIRVTAG
jgi:hypothetical protein